MSGTVTSIGGICISMIEQLRTLYCYLSSPERFSIFSIVLGNAGVSIGLLNRGCESRTTVQARGVETRGLAGSLGPRQMQRRSALHPKYFHLPPTSLEKRQ